MFLSALLLVCLRRSQIDSFRSDGHHRQAAVVAASGLVVGRGSAAAEAERAATAALVSS